MSNLIFMQRIDRCLAWLSRALSTAAMMLLGAMTILIAMQVLSRNLFNIGLPWADELARFIGIASVFFAIPLLQYQGKHIAVDILSSRFTGMAGRVLKIVNETVVLSFCLLFLYSLACFLKHAAYFVTPAIGMPNWIFYAPVLVGMVLCTLVAGLRLARLVCSWNTAPGPLTAPKGTQP